MVQQVEKQAYLYEKLEDGYVKCKTCCRECRISPDSPGFCKTRENRDGKLYSLEYGLISLISINPIEKKPLYHFYPGTNFLTIGSWSCTFNCPWCQNWDISKTEPKNKKVASKTISPIDLVRIAKEKGCKGTSMSFSEPTTFLEYAVDVFELARQSGLANMVVTNGYFTPEAADLLIEKGANAFNIDIKGDAKAYEKYCSADSEKVWANVQRIKEKGGHVELTTLVIPSVNDSDACLSEIARRIKKEASPATPWHISRYFPAYRFDAPPPSIASLEKAYDIAKEAGLLYVYLGNVSGHKYENTYCPACGEELIKRTALTIDRNKVTKDKKCPNCEQEIPIVADS
jgi:pyruvate formate lyase activating enzyme